MGSGRQRIGTNLEIRDDLYCMAFTASFHAEYIVAAQVKKEVNEKDFAEIIERQS